jgi:hypothetical protein
MNWNQKPKIEQYRVPISQYVNPHCKVRRVDEKNGEVWFLIREEWQLGPLGYYAWEWQQVKLIPQATSSRLQT